MPTTPVSPSSSSASSATKRACDPCHKRKVKCKPTGGGTPACQNCTSAGLACTYNAVPQKKGPKGHRAKVISELRHSQRQVDADDSGHDGAHDRLTDSPFAPTPGLLTPELVDSCINLYLTHLYPSQPVLDQHQCAAIATASHTSIEAYCLLASLCAYVALHPSFAATFVQLVDYTDSSQTSQAPGTGPILLQEVVRVRNACNYSEEPTASSVATSYFLFSHFSSLGKVGSAWYYLREATTFGLALGMNEVETYTTLEFSHAQSRRRLYWSLVIAERTYALQHRRPISLSGMIGLPLTDQSNPHAPQLAGFVHMIRLLRSFDDAFISVWNKIRAGCSQAWLSEVQQQVSVVLYTHLHCDDTQVTDLRVTQHWLNTLVWQLSMSCGFLSSHAVDPIMTFNYPIEIARDLLGAINGIPSAIMEIHGIGLIEKLFDIACTLSDVVACVPPEQQVDVRPRQYLHNLINLIGSLKGGRDRYLPLLLAKVNDSTSPPPVSTPHHYTPIASVAPSVTESSTSKNWHPNNTDYFNGYDSSQNSAVTSPITSPRHSAIYPPWQTSYLGGTPATSMSSSVSPDSAMSTPVEATSRGLENLNGILSSHNFLQQR